MNRNIFLSRFAASGIAMVDQRFEDLVAANLAKVDSIAEAFEAEGANASAEDDFFSPNNPMVRYRPYEVKDGTLVIPVMGVLLADFPYSFGSYATGYEYIKQAALRGAADYSVKKIALSVNSPGGQVDECFPLVDLLAEIGKKKPIRAFAKSAYSAAYALSSAADKIIVAPVTGGVGSIGVVTSHVDYSKMLEKEGIKVTFIQFGKHKTDGSPWKPLSKDAQERIQAEIDRMGEIFVATVARNRGMEGAAVRATEALTYVAEQAVAIGLADSVGSLEDALVEFKAETKHTIEERTTDMTNPVTTPAAASTEPAVDNAQAIEAAKAEGSALGEKKGADAARATAKAILGLPEAEGRGALAQELAFMDGMTEDKAKVLLAAAPKAAAPKAEGNAFMEAMNGGNPEIGATAGSQGEENTPKAIADRMGANFKKATGRA